MSFEQLKNRFKILKIILLINMLLLTIGLLAQKKSNLPFPKPPPNPNSPQLKCLYYNKYTNKQRLNFYPFNIASYVQLISFKDTINSIDDTQYLTNDVKSLFGKSYEMVTLNKEEVLFLTDILFNYSFRGKKYEEETTCYEPRNAIVFSDSKGTELERIELCFECNQYRKTSNAIKAGDFCVGKYDLLKSLFLKVGIKYGIIY